MIDIVVVLRAEDAVLDFLSVLTDPEAREVHVLCARAAESVVLAAGSNQADRLAALARRERPVDEAAASPGPGPLAEAIG
ncbi:hypothetical protein ACFQ6Q_30680, partial [Streptomyces sp. NPDC056437]